LFAESDIYKKNLSANVNIFAASAMHEQSRRSSVMSVLLLAAALMFHNIAIVN
jgi:hypothetical protein